MGIAKASIVLLLLMTLAGCGQDGAPSAGAEGLADSAAVADGLSTAFMILSEAEVAGVCGRRADTTAILLTDAPNGRGIVRFGAALDLHRDGGGLPDEPGAQDP